MSEPRYFSMRLLSPYQGTVQVVEAPGFRAMSVDGTTWQVQVLTPELPVPRLRSAAGIGASRQRTPRTTRFSTHGVWRADGSGNFIETERTRGFVQVLRSLPPLPFPLADRLELWLLDARENLPLALVGSTLSHISPPRVAEATWRSTLVGDTAFFAPSLSPATGAAAVSAIPIPHREVLTRCVRAAAGPLPRAQWFRRAPDGSGFGLKGCRLPEQLAGRELQRDVFPELLVREQWVNDHAAGLVRDYHDWQAPSLLTHSGLNRTTRDRLERAACRQPERLYDVRHLLPEIVNPDLLKVALVEAVLRRSVRPGGETAAR